MRENWTKPISQSVTGNSLDKASRLIMKEGMLRSRTYRSTWSLETTDIVISGEVVIAVGRGSHGAVGYRTVGQGSDRRHDGDRN